MIKFLAERKFNYIDVVALSTANTLLIAQQYALSGIVLVAGLILSIFLEVKLKDD